MYQFLLIVLIVLSVSADYDDNLRISLTADHVKGYMMICLLQRRPNGDILSDVHKAMGDRAYAENRMRDLLVDAISLSVVPVEADVQLIWREERLKVARQLKQVYEGDRKVLNRVLAIDELTIMNGKLEMIAACDRSQFVHFEFVRTTGKSKKDDMLRFLGNLAAKLTIDKPIILWDNINIHDRNKDVAMFIRSKEWEVWPHPVDSSDMNPLDYSEFKQLKREWTVNADMTVEQAEESVRIAINKINKGGSLQGIVALPMIWEALVRTNGLMTV